MKNLLLICMISMLTYEALAQSRELSLAFSSYRFESTEYAIVNGYGDIWETEATDRLLNASLGYYFPVLTPYPNLGIGINASLMAGMIYQSTSSRGIDADFGLPVAATIRYGAGSTREAFHPIGIGLGAGYKLNTLVVMSGDPFYIKNDANTLVLCRPYFFAELVFDFLKRNNSFFDNLKIQVAIQPAYSKTSSGSDLNYPTKTKMNYYSVSFIKFSTLD